MDHAAQEGSGGKHDRPGGDGVPACERDARDPSPPVQNEVLHSAGAQFEAGLFVQQRSDRPAVQLAVGLGARSLHGRPLAAVQHPELDARPVDGAAHDTVERVDLAHQVALAEPADRRIAGHFADGFELMGHEQRPRTPPRRGGGRFAACMAPANDNDVEPAHALSNRPKRAVRQVRAPRHGHVSRETAAAPKCPRARLHAAASARSTAISVLC